MNASTGLKIKSNNLTQTIIENIIDEIRSKKHKPLVERIRAEKDKSKRGVLKKKLPYFVPAGLFEDNQRGKDLWNKDSGLVILDVDEYDEKKSSEMVGVVSSMPSTLAAFLSPSAGLKIIVNTERVDTPTPEAYLSKWQHAKGLYEKKLGVEIDPSGKDPSRACFFSYDPDAYFNNKASPLAIPEKQDVSEAITNVAELPWPRADETLNQARERASSYLKKKHPAVRGQQGHSSQLEACLTLTNGFNIRDREEVKRLFMDWDKNSQPPLEKDSDINHKVDDALKIPPKNGRARGHLNDLKEPPKSEPEPRAKKKGLALTWFKDTEERKPDWLWPSYLLKGASHVLGGKQGTSKGLFTVDIASRITRGDPMPDGTGGGEPAKVLIVTREDSPEDALKPRLRIAGANMDNIAWTYGDFSDGKAIPTMKDGVEAITEAVKNHNIKLVIIDPIGAWVEDDMNNGQAVRAVIDPMSKVARDTGCCILFVAHLKKSPTEDLMDAFSGSAQVTAAVRVALHIGPVTADGKRKILNVVKTNYKRPDEPMVYELWKDFEWSDDTPPKLAWKKATEEDRASSNSKSKDAPSVPRELVLEFIPDGHTKVKEAAKWIQKKLKAKDRSWSRVTQTSIETTFRELEAEGLLFYGTNLKGAEIIGKEPPPKAKSKREQACEESLEFPDKTIREIAESVGCSNGEAHAGVKQANQIRADEKAKREDVDSCSVDDVQLVDIEQPNTEQDQPNSTCEDVQLLALSPFRGEREAEQQNKGIGLATSQAHPSTTQQEEA